MADDLHATPLKVVRSRVSDGSAVIASWGQLWEVVCRTGKCRWRSRDAYTEREAREEARDHLRWTHPNEERAEQDAIMEAERRL